MEYFTADNWPATRAQLEIANLAYDEAWGALKGAWQRRGEDVSDDFVADVRKNLGGAVNNAFQDGEDSGRIAERALKLLGYRPRRSIYSLECE